MKNILNIWNVKWIHLQNPKRHELLEIWEELDLHEIIIEDILEYWTQDKIDNYDNNIFMIFHFPKYDEKQKRYIWNELSVILGKDYIVTITSHQTNHIDKIRDEYIKETSDLENPERYKISPYYILFKILDIMFDKTLRILTKSTKDIIFLEEEIFSKNWLNKKVLEEMMIKRRNVVFLKHLFLPQEEIILELQKTTEKFYNWQLDLYFEDLQYKLDKINNNISILTENLNSLSEIYNNLMNIRLNWVISKLTAFTLIIWVMTLIVWTYWMNVSLPFDWNENIFYYLLIWMFLLSTTLLLIFKKWWWFN